MHTAKSVIVLNISANIRQILKFSCVFVAHSEAWANEFYFC